MRTWKVTCSDGDDGDDNDDDSDEDDDDDDKGDLGCAACDKGPVSVGYTEPARNAGMRYKAMPLNAEITGSSANRGVKCDTLDDTALNALCHAFHF